jgi:hypothetical protein
MKDSREFASPIHYPEFTLQIYEADTHIAISVDVSNPKGGPRKSVLVAMNADQAREVIAALHEAIALSGR